MSQIITGFHYDIGGREVYEDRVDIQEIVTAANLNLTVAVVADGVGGENKGERAAQMAKDAVFHYLKNGVDTDVPTLLTKAAMYANRAVFQGFQHTGGASTTLAIAAIHDQKSLYVANVGDSRVYLCRDKKLVQLTLDHSFANVKPWSGEITPQEARAHPRAEALMRALGPRERIPIDIGFYLGTTDPQAAHEKGKRGLSLRNGDSVLVCSDGLIKISRQTGQPLTTDSEIVQVLTTQEGTKAARSLVSFALGRAADDNVTAAILQMPDRARRRRARRPLFVAASLITLLVIILAVSLYTFLRREEGLEEELDIAAQTSTASAIEALGVAETATRAAFEQAFRETAVAATQTAQPTMMPTLTPFPRVPLAPGEIGVRFNLSGEFSPFREREDIDAGSEFISLNVNHDDSDAEPGNVYAWQNTFLRFTSVNGDRMALALFPGSNIFIETGRYVGGAEVTLSQAASVVQFTVAGSCMSINYPTTESPEAVVSCYAGDCQYAVDFGQPTPIEVGTQILFDTQQLEVTQTGPIPVADILAYEQDLRLYATGMEDAEQCLASFIPTPTPTRPPPTVAVPTDTPAPTNSSGSSSSGSGGNSPTNTPKPPTNTPKPPTNTPKPPTNTPQPPTNTPNPPTDTPEPPTNTPEPPTDTPEPPTDTPEPPTDTPEPPTDTPEPPTDTPEPPTDTPEPPTDTPEPPTSTPES